MTDAAPGRRPALVLDADLRQSLVTVRSLGRAGVSVHVAEAHAGPPAFVSRWAASRTVLPDVAADPDAFVAAVCELCASLDCPVLITSHDGSIEALRAQRDRVEGLATLALAPERALALAIDKRTTLAAARRLGLAVPEGSSVENLAEAEQVLDRIGLPVVVKPAISWADGGKQAWRAAPVLARSREQALELTSLLLESGAGALLQRWLPGAREAVSVMFARGRMWATFAQRAKRMYPVLGGSSVLRESIGVPADIGPASEALVRELGLEGYSEIEFRRDGDGRAYLMEINSRLSASVEIAVRAGVDFPLLLYRWAAGEPMRAVEGYRRGRHMRHLGGDVGWLKEAVRDPGHPDAPSRAVAIASFFGSFARPTGYDYWDIGDPAPAALIGSRVARGLPARTARALGRGRALFAPPPEQP